MKDFIGEYSNKLLNIVDKYWQYWWLLLIAIIIGAVYLILERMGMFA